jgi:hypothetical protein
MVITTCIRFASMVVVLKVDVTHQKHNKSSSFVKLAIDFFGFTFSSVAM